MKNFKNILVFLLATILCFNLIGCSFEGRGESESDESETFDPFYEGEDESENYPFGKYVNTDFSPVLRFVVASDIHIDDEGSEEEERRLAQLFDDAYRYSGYHESYKELDGVFFVGDIVNSGTLTSFKKFFSIVDEHKSDDTVVRAVLGDNEYTNDPTLAESNLMDAGGYDSVDTHLVINGFHFILISPNMNGEGFDEAKQSWLESELKVAAEDDPTGKKPIFVLQHQPLTNTVYGSSRWGVDHLRKILNEYPQVVDFSGHSHYPINDPRSVWQGEFSAFGAGTLSYYRVDLTGTQSGDITPGTNKTHWKGDSAKDAAQFYIVEVDANNALNVQAFDLFTSTFIMKPVILSSVGDTVAFTYTNERRKTADKPVFDATPINEQIGDDKRSITVMFKQAECDDLVQHYRCTLYEDGRIHSVVYCLAGSLYFPTPETISVVFTDLKPQKGYDIEVIAVSSWGIESRPKKMGFLIAS